MFWLVERPSSPLPSPPRRGGNARCVFVSRRGGLVNGFSAGLEARLYGRKDSCRYRSFGVEPGVNSARQIEAGGVISWAMKVHRTIFAAAAIFTAGIFAAAAQTNSPITTAPVYVPDTTHQNDPLPDGVIAFDATTKAVDAVEGTDFAHFTFNFTNISADIVTVLNVHPSCGCTTAELPPVPWQLTPGTNGQIQLKVNLAGKMGTLFKTVNFMTDKGKRDLMLRINLTPPPVVTLSEEQQMAGILAAKSDRMAISRLNRIGFWPWLVMSRSSCRP